MFPSLPRITVDFWPGSLTLITLEGWTSISGKPIISLTGFGKRLKALGWETKRRNIDHSGRGKIMCRIPPKNGHSLSNYVPNYVMSIEDSDSNGQDHIQKEGGHSRTLFSHNLPISKKQLPREDFIEQLCPTMSKEKKEVSDTIVNSGFETPDTVEKNYVPENTNKFGSNSDSESYSDVGHSLDTVGEDNSDYDFIV